MHLTRKTVFALGLALAFGLTLLPSRAQAATWLQNQIHTSRATTNGTQTYTFSFGNTFHAQDGLAVFVQTSNVATSYNISSVTDDASNTYTQLQEVTDTSGSNIFVALFALARVPGTPTQITVTMTGSITTNGHIFIFADEVQNAISVDKSALAQAASSTTVSSGSVTTTGNDLVLGMTTPDGSPAVSAGAGFVFGLNDTVNALFTEYLNQGGPAAIAATFGFSPAGTAPVGLIAFAPACLPGSLALTGVGC